MKRAELKMSELKAKAYQLAKKITGHTISQVKHLKRWLHQGLDFRRKSSWVEAISLWLDASRIALLENILARNIVPQLLAA